MTGNEKPMENTAKPAFDDLMLAMDAVDTIRFESSVLESELSGDDRRDALKVRLREYYAGQGIEVSDEVLATAVADMDKNRFVHEPIQPGLAKVLATAYVRRKAYAKRVVAFAAIAGITAGGAYAFNREFVDKPRERAAVERQLALSTKLPLALAEAHGRALAAAKEYGDEAAAAVADNQKAAVEKLIAAGDAEGAESGVSKLSALAAGIREKIVVAALMEDAKTVKADALSRVSDNAALGVMAPLVDRLASDAAAGDESLYRKDKTALAALVKRIETPLELRIVDRAGTRSGVWRTNDGGSTRVYYIVVEAIDPAGNAVPMDIRSVETGRTSTVTTWAVHVPESEYNRVARDKQSDGIVDDRKAGTKPAGSLAFSWSLPVRDGQMITSW